MTRRQQLEAILAQAKSLHAQADAILSDATDMRELEIDIDSFNMAHVDAAHRCLNTIRHFVGEIQDAETDV